MAKFQLFQNIERKHFSWGIFFLKSEILDCRPTTVLQILFRNFQEHSFLSDLFKKSICSGVFSSAVDCRMYSINCFKKELYYIIFSGYFPKLLVFQNTLKFQNTLIKLSVMELSIVLGCVDYSPVF